MDPAQPVDASDVPRWKREFEAAAEAHVLSHPEAVRDLFLLRQSLDDLLPDERAEAVKEIYTELRSLWGDQDCRGQYTMEEVLGNAHMYRLWLDANRCAYSRCKHAEGVAAPADLALMNRLAFMRSMAKRLQDEEFAIANS